MEWEIWTFKNPLSNSVGTRAHMNMLTVDMHVCMHSGCVAHNEVSGFT